ncbi:hypothetical protein Tco_1513873, partial [Tanacetum coccineum]
MGGVIAQTRSERASKHSYDSPLSGVNTTGNDEERIEHQELTNNIPPTPHDLPLSGGYTPRSDEGRPDLHELMAIYTKLSDRVLDLEKEKDAQAVEILKLKNRIKKLERKANLSIPPLKRRLYKQVDSFDNSLGKENASKQGRNDSNKTEDFNLSDKGSGGTEVFDNTTAAKKNVNTTELVSTAGDACCRLSTSTAGDIFEDEMMTITDTLMAIRSTRPRTTSVVIRDVKEEPRIVTPVPTVQSQDKGKSKIVEPKPTLKNPIKAQIQRDVEIAQRLFEEDQAQFEREQGIIRERAAEQEAKDAALIEKMEDVQVRMDAYILLAERLQQEEREQFTIEEKSIMLVDMIIERKRFFDAQRAAKQRSKPPTKAQMRNKMCTYLKNQSGYNYNQLKGRSYDEVQKLFDKAYKQVNSYIPMDSEVVKD